MLDQDEKSFVSVRLGWREPGDFILVGAVPTQDKALRKRNLSGGGNPRLSDSATASASAGAVLLSGGMPLNQDSHAKNFPGLGVTFYSGLS